MILHLYFFKTVILLFLVLLYAEISKILQNTVLELNDD
jgi:hypothetical protein